MSTGHLKQKPATIDELIGSSREGFFELVDGQLERVHMSPYTSRVAYLLGLQLGRYLETKPLGDVFEAEVYYRCFGSSRYGRKPDLSFVRKERIPPDWKQLGYFSMVPDLVVEVVSPKDRAGKLRRKINEYRQASVPLLWVIYPLERVASVYFPGGYDELDENGWLSGREVLPGFKVRLGDLLP